MPGTSVQLEWKSDREDLVRTYCYIIFPLQLRGGLSIRTPSRMSPNNPGLHKLLQDGREAKKPVIGMPHPSIIV